MLAFYIIKRLHNLRRYLKDNKYKEFQVLTHIKNMLYISAKAIKQKLGVESFNP